MKYLLLLLSLNSYADQIKIAIIDSGLNQSLIDESTICKTGHYDFVSNTEIIGRDEINHGTPIAIILNKYIKNKNYCLLIYKIVSRNNKRGTISSLNIYRALQAAKENGASYINYSITGTGFSQMEYDGLQEVKDIKVFAAAGNEGKRLDSTECHIYSACYGFKHVRAIGAIDSNEMRLSFSNYGKMVTDYQLGLHVIFGQEVRGTSFAAPVALAKDINNNLPTKKVFTNRKERDKIIKEIRRIPLGE